MATSTPPLYSASFLWNSLDFLYAAKVDTVTFLSMLNIIMFCFSLKMADVSTDCLLYSNYDWNYGFRTEFCSHRRLVINGDVEDVAVL